MSLWWWCGWGDAAVGGMVMVLCCCYYPLDLDAGGTVPRTQPRRQLLLLVLQLQCELCPTPLSLCLWPCVNPDGASGSVINLLICWLCHYKYISSDKTYGVWLAMWGNFYITWLAWDYFLDPK
jgi:hypothetical protein